MSQTSFLQHLFSLTGTLAPPQAVGPVPEGLRLIFPVASGEFSGPRLKGRILEGGAEYDLATGRVDFFDGVPA